MLLNYLSYNSILFLSYCAFKSFIIIKIKFFVNDF